MKNFSGRMVETSRMFAYNQPCLETFLVKLTGPTKMYAC